MADLDRIAQAYRHCEALVRAQDKDRYLASLFAPAERRRYLFALYAFALEIGRVREAVTEPMTGVIRLQWWLEAATGLRAAEAAASPVMIALQDAAERTNVALTPLASAVEARQAELEGVHASIAEETIFRMAARFLLCDGAVITTASEHAGQAVSMREKARAAYAAFCAQVEGLPDAALPAFLPVALVPLRLKNPSAPQWRKQLTLLRAAWFGFPKV